MSSALRVRITAIALLFLASCTNSAENAQSPPVGTAHEFSDADKKIARSLSLGNASLVSEATDPRYEASICRDAIIAIEQRLRSTDILSGEMARSLELAKEIYARRAAAEAAAPGASSGPGPEGAGDGHAGDASQLDQGRAALACIERLQQGGAN